MIVGAAWILAILALTLLSYRRFFVAPGSVLTDPDAMDFAQIARNMANGHGYATSVLRPLALTGFAPADATGVAPDVSRAPLYPFLLMLVALAHGRSLGDNTVVLVSLLLFLGSAFAVYRLGRTLFPAPEQAWIALLSAGLYAVSGEALGYALLGLPVTLAGLLVTLLLIALHRAVEMPGRPPARPGSALVVGVLLGLCYLTQYSLLLLAVPALFYLFFTRGPERSWAAVGACALGFFVVTGGWLIRTARLCHGDPFFTLLYYSVMSNTDAYPGDTTIYRSVAPASGPLVYFFTHLPDMLGRLGTGLTFYCDTLLESFNVFLLAAAAASLLWRSPDIRLNALRAFTAVGLLLVVVVTSVFQPAGTIIAPFMPLITVFAVGFVFRVVAEQNIETLLQRTAVWSLGLLVGLGAMIQFAGKKPTPPDPISQGIQRLDTLGLTTSQGVITDAPWEISWRTGLPSLWIPADNPAYEASLANAGVPVEAILLTPLLRRYNASQKEALDWVLFSENPLAFDTEPKVAEAAVNYVRAKVPRLNGKSADELQQTREYQIAYGDYMAHYDPAYVECGSISEVLAAFQVPDPNSPLVSESNTDTSVVFVRRQTAGTGG